MSNYEFNKDYPAKRKVGRPKRVMTTEAGAAQIMDIIETDEKIKRTRTSPEEAKQAIRDDVKQAASAMQDATKYLNVVFNESKRLKAENEKLRVKVDELKAEVKELNKWRDVAEALKKTLFEEA